jgi:hypothetical protein
MGYPVIFQSDLFTAANLAVNQIVSPDERQFLNRTQSWLRVRSIGIAVCASGESPRIMIPAYNQHTGAWPFADLDWMIRIGPTNITPDFVPVEAVTYNVAGEEPSLTLPFRRPVYLAPLDRIQIQIKYRTAWHDHGQQFYIFARCEVVDRPLGLFVPAIMGWRGESYGAVGAFTIDVPFSTFQNDANEPLEVDRFIAKLTAGNDVAARYALLREFKIRMELQDGTRVTREAQPLGVIAEIGKQSWTPGITLPAGGYVKIDCEGSLDDAHMPTIVPHFGLIGYREIG